MKHYIIPIKDYEAIVQRGKDIASKKPETPYEQYREFKEEKNNPTEQINPQVL